ncbi:pre-peptidase C-terminal domain-containing protein [Sulfitobacter sp. G21635-S1]|uniref:pre-peptidase C-terminal domain-containing protein n=1 Tax=Sulfitobacter sp. G21635-S1 TaxID=3014043 RepID=UPI0022AF5EDA|nr:pre-peptidase C-terminal domain-containing protein [Sulfitobacter sp. G21635-S1]MCZ4255682.1 pre-peptidase C-terminal domain-containing protein [Sulfitobacter sp. G21635-S1]
MSITVTSSGMSPDHDPTAFFCGCDSCMAEKEESGALPDDAAPEIGPDIGETPGTAGTINVGQTIVNTIDVANDNDWFRITLTAGQSIQITLNGSSVGGGTLSDPLVRLYDASGSIIDSDDDGGPGLNSLLNFYSENGGVFYISAEAYGSNTGTYTLSVQEVTFNPNDSWEDSPDFASPLLDSISWDTRFDHNVITVYFGEAGYTADGVTSEGFNAYERQQFMRAFDAIEAVTNLTFNIVNSGDGADWELILDTNELDGVYGRFNPPGYGGDGNDGVGQFAGNLWDRFAGGDLTEGGFGYFTIMHELLHGLGLAHPHDTGGDSSVMPGVGSSRDDFGDFNINQGVFTMMSYNPGYHTGTPGSAPADGTGDGTGVPYGYAAGPMALDIAVLQGLYGANNSHNSGNTTYVLPTGTGAGVFWSTIWDSGGNDTIRHNGAGAAVIDLRAATLAVEMGGGGFVSAVNGTRGGFTIAAGTVIENAVGGNAGDLIFGNQANNQLSGFGGFDTMHGGAGNDTIDGGNGADSLYGGAGNDLIIGSDGFDQLFGEAGNDTLQGGNTNDYLFGGDGNDLLLGGLNIGTSTELLDGGAGNDTLRGEGGFDLLRGGDGDDVLDGGNQADNLYGDAGNDTLFGGAGFDRLFGGTGDDVLNGGDGPDGHFGQQGNDTIYGGDGNDRFFGGTGNDLILAGNGNDTIYADSGFDTLNGGAGNDLLFGFFNADTFVFEAGHGNDTIGDFDEFNAGERIDFSGLGTMNNLTQVLNASTQIGNNVVINTGGGNSIQLNGVQLADLDASDFIF